MSHLSPLPYAPVRLSVCLSRCIIITTKTNLRCRRFGFIFSASDQDRAEGFPRISFIRADCMPVRKESMSRETTWSQRWSCRVDGQHGHDWEVVRERETCEGQGWRQSQEMATQSICAIVAEISSALARCRVYSTDYETVGILPLISRKTLGILGDSNASRRRRDV